MRAVICHESNLSVEDLPEPQPARGQARLTVTRTGICGSDLHARTGLDSWAEIAASIGYHRFAHGHDRVVFGHEYVGAVAEYGPKTPQRMPPGTPVVAMPIIRNAEHVDSIGLSPHAPGAYAEQLLVQAGLMLAVPNGLDPEIAALTEPLAVARHAVARSEITKGQPAIVIGAGPIGLAVILLLKAAGVRTVIASDLSAGRRELAVRCGADVVVDPAEHSPYDPPGTRLRVLRSAPAAYNLAIDAVERADKLPLVDWRHLHRVAQSLGASPSGPVIFECVGLPGMLESVITDAPLFTRVVVVGVCVGQDRFMPARASQKEIDLRFVFGYTPLEFRDTLHLLADGRVDPRPLITGTVGLDGVGAAFDALADADRHAKILIDPASSATSPA